MEDFLCSAKASICALDIAIKYAEKQMGWYSFSGLSKFLLYRISGLFAIFSTLFVAYLSASLSEKEGEFLGYKRSNLISIFSFSAAISISLSSFFAWDSSWKSHRIAQFELESTLNATKIERYRLLEEENDEELFKLAEKLSRDVGDIVLKESELFFNGLKSAQNSVGSGINPPSGTVGQDSD
ncbi:hypothetical protein [uncultured Hoeflea sp.]|uniref:hypothetical protein n=1 Tax=uncultured Hoeflea sp. TaxID=538666 RepID=UPI0030D91FA7|tara:strand:- start:2089 stop:2637 length:549 start_codon:yes stop_codon:yes gene_type:complete